MVALGKPADFHLIEPLAHLNSEQRIVAAILIKRCVLHAKKTAFIVGDDLTMSSYLADRIVVHAGAGTRL